MAPLRAPHLRRPAGPLRMDELEQCVRALDPASRALLDLSLRHRVRDDDMAPILRIDPFNLAWRRARMIERIATQMGLEDPAGIGLVRAALPNVPERAWGVPVVVERPAPTVTRDEAEAEAASVPEHALRVGAAPARAAAEPDHAAAAQPIGATAAAPIAEPATASPASDATALVPRPAAELALDRWTEQRDRFRHALATARAVANPETVQAVKRGAIWAAVGALLARLFRRRRR